MAKRWKVEFAATTVALHFTMFRLLSREDYGRMLLAHVAIAGVHWLIVEVLYTEGGK